MSAFGSAVGRAVGVLGGPQLAAVIVVGGLLVGAGAGGFIAAGGPSSTSGSSTAQLSIYPCPGVGPALQTVPAGQRFLVTGRSDDGQWARIHYPGPGRTEAWVQVSPLTFQASLQSVPVATCAPVTAAAEPSVGPAASLTAIQSNSPSPAPTPTPAAPPSLSKLAVSTTKISYDQGSYCPNATKQVTFTVDGTAGAGLTGVTLFWRAPGAGSYTKTPMSLAAGTADSGTWQLTLDTTANSITSAGKLRFYALGTDLSGATGRMPSSGARTITVAVCANTGPTIRSAASSRSTIRWDPLSVGGCTTATTFSATITDVDGVKSATLYYLRPGSPSWSTKPMTQKAGTNSWSASLDTTADKITISTPPTGNLKWYIKAVDKTGLATQTKSATITIRRCDSRADIASTGYTVPSPYPSSMCPRWATTFYGWATDPDGISGSSAEFIYTYVLTNGTKKTATATMSGTYDGKWYYHVTIKPTYQWSTGGATMTYHIKTTDIYGGTSTGGSGKITQHC